MLLEYYEKLLQLKCFSFDDAAKIFGDERKARNILSALKGKFHYSLPGNLKFWFFEFSRKIGKLSTSIGSSSTATRFFVDKIHISSLAGITSFAILILVDWCAVRIIPRYIFLSC